MKFSTIASSLLLAGTAVAAPGTAMRRERHAKRAALRSTNPLNVSETQTFSVTDIQTNKTQSKKSYNWAGAIVSGSGLNEVTGTFTVPEPLTDGSGSGWVGIDGDSCDTAILQTGVDWTKSGDSYSYNAWYEWYPDYAYDFSDISISAGDVVKVTVFANSLSEGTAWVENETTGESVTHTFASDEIQAPLCQEDAEWIVEDYSMNGELVTFANFGTIAFTDAYAITDGEIVDPDDSTITDIVTKDDAQTILTDCSASATDVTCVYRV